MSVVGCTQACGVGADWTSKEEVDKKDVFVMLRGNWTSGVSEMRHLASFMRLGLSPGWGMREKPTAAAAGTKAALFS